MTTRDRLLLLKPGFEDPAFPGQRFYCWHCALLEGVLASFPELAARLDVERIDWARPRAAVVTVLGFENQTLPVLLLADDGATAPGARAHAGSASSTTRTESCGHSRRGTGFPCRIRDIE